MKTKYLLSTALSMTLLLSLTACYLSGGSGGGENTTVTPPVTYKTATVNITGAIEKTVTVPINVFNYSGTYQVIVGNDSNLDLVVRFDWATTPTANQSYSTGSGIDTNFYVREGDRTWEYWLSYTVTLTSLDPASGTITGQAEEQDEYCCDKTKGETNPINVSITFSGI